MTAPFSEDQILLLVMAIVPVKDDFILQQMKERFVKRDRQHSSWDVEAEYRLDCAKAIVDRWKRHVRVSK